MGVRHKSSNRLSAHDAHHSEESLRLALPPNAYVSSSTSEIYEVVLTSKYVCQGLSANFNVTIGADMHVSITFRGIQLPLEDLEISNKLIDFTKSSVQSLMMSLMTLRVCCGMEKTCTLGDNFPNAAQVMWTSPGGEDKLYIQSMTCKGVIPLLSPVMVCNVCRNIMPSVPIAAKQPKLSKSLIVEKSDRPIFVVTPMPGSSHPCVRTVYPSLTTETIVNVRSQFPSDLSPAQCKTNDVCIHSPELPVTPTNGPKYHPSSTNPVTPEQAEAKPGNESAMTISERTEHLSTPECKTTSDMAVGTTPLKTPTDVLMKFFPHLAKHPKLLQIISDQVSLAAQEDPRGRRYDKAIVSLALTLWTRSPHSYQELLNAGFIFPSPTTLSLYKNCVSQRPGLVEDMFRWMFKEAQRNNISKAGFHGGLVLDEMNVQKDLQVSSRGGEWRLTGLADLGEASNAMAAMSKNKQDVQMSDHVLQFLFHGFTGFRMPFAYFPTTQANACDLYINVWDSVSALRDWGFVVNYISIDGSSNNRAFVKMLFPDGNPRYDNMVVSDRSELDNEIVILPDPSHVIKKIRNSVFNSGLSPSHSRQLSLNGKEIIWQHWVDAYLWCQDRDINPIAPHPNLNKECIFLTDPGKMRNAFAEQALNNNMYFLMEAYQKSLPTEQACQLDSTLEFLKHTSVLVRIFRDHRPIEHLTDLRLEELREVLSWHDDWVRISSGSRELMAAECREDLTWMLIGFEALVVRCNALGISVPPCDINSDVIENFFCSQRGIMGGSKSNPSVHNYMHNINSIVIGQPILSTKSNAGAKGKAALPYKFNTPMPLRQKSKKPKRLQYESFCVDK